MPYPDDFDDAAFARKWGGGNLSPEAAVRKEVEDKLEALCDKFGQEVYAILAPHGANIEVYRTISRRDVRSAEDYAEVALEGVKDFCELDEIYNPLLHGDM